MGGYKSTLDNDLWRHEEWVGVTFGIGLDGSIDQYCSIFDAHWGNGIAGSVPRYNQRGNSRLAALAQIGRWNPRPSYSLGAHSLDYGGINLLNARSISTEHEDKGVTNVVWTEAMYLSDVKVKKWCLEELNRYGRTMPVSPEMLVGHFEIDAVNRPYCPGGGYPRPRIYADISGGVDVFVVHDQEAKFQGSLSPGWKGRAWNGPGKMNVNADCDIPLEADMVKLAVRLKTPIAAGAVLAYGNGGGGHAGVLRAGADAATLDVVVKDGWLEFVGTNIVFESVRSVGYWKW